MCARPIHPPGRAPCPAPSPPRNLLHPLHTSEMMSRRSSTWQSAPPSPGRCVVRASAAPATRGVVCKAWNVGITCVPAAVQDWLPLARPGHGRHGCTFNRGREGCARGGLLASRALQVRCHAALRPACERFALARAVLRARGGAAKLSALLAPAPAAGCCWGVRRHLLPRAWMTRRHWLRLRGSGPSPSQGTFCLMLLRTPTF